MISSLFKHALRGQCSQQHLVNTDLSPFRFTSVYSAEAMVASGVLPWQLMCCRSSASLYSMTLA
jgi:hypothetical protein